MLALLALLLAACLAAGAPLAERHHLDAAPEASSGAPHRAAAAARAPVRWRTRFGPELVGGSTVRLEWDGGRRGAAFEVYYVPHVHGEWDYDLMTISHTTETSVMWRVPDVSFFSGPTTIIVGVKQVGGKGVGWYDLSDALPLIDREARDW
ncbi:hypothetical protein Q5752_002530 [Cryptotrichosporon argae]